MHRKMSKQYKVCVLGAGSWGGTLAWMLSKKNYQVTIWTFSKEEYKALSKTRKLIKPKKISLDKNIKITTNLHDAVSNANIIVIAVPSNAYKSLVTNLKKQHIKSNTLILSATKGFIQPGSQRASAILKKHFPKISFGILSGPNIALDVISNTPIISVIASNKISTARALQEIITSKYFRIYINQDVIGVELAGALKNVIAIAAGVSDGLGFSTSTKAALISRGLIEISKLTLKEGGSTKTLLGAAGIGDLIATCCSTNSRNYKVGYNLAKGKNLSSILKELGQVAEGAETVKAMVKLAKKNKVQAPIADAVHEIVIKKKKPKTVLKKLIARPITKLELDF